jgi:phosphate transport system protein
LFSIFKGADSLRGVESQLDKMLSDCRQMYSLATSAIFGEAAPDSVSEELWSLDKGVNRAERAIRRELLIHGTVRHAEMEQGLMLAYMSVAKDIERIGDYCKNIWDLANHGVDLSGHDDSGMIRGHAMEVADMLDKGARAFVAQDEKQVHELIPKIEMAAAGHDQLVFEYIQSQGPGSIAAPRALYFRFLKRITGHMANVLSSVVMPLDRIDFYKGPKARDQ